MARTNSAVGFSTIELLTGFAVFGIVTAIALPGWRSWFPTYALNNAARQLQSELHHIKMRAAAENISFQLAYSQGANAYSIQRDSKTLVTKPLSDGTTITKSGNIAFSPRGTASANRVRVSNVDGKCRQIVVSATGRIRSCPSNSCLVDC
ncbi:MAG TPA: GspH/FimT family pseudopilin [Candidatus Binatus sp.]|nr:GspH/FimT family pseudopilin [Candidatus Binatus sp.]